MVGECAVSPLLIQLFDAKNDDGDASKKNRLVACGCQLPRWTLDTGFPNPKASSKNNSLMDKLLFHQHLAPSEVVALEAVALKWLILNEYFLPPIYYQSSSRPNHNYFSHWLEARNRGAFFFNNFHPLRTQPMQERKDGHAYDSSIRC